MASGTHTVILPESATNYTNAAAGINILRGMGLTPKIWELVKDIAPFLYVSRNYSKISVPGVDYKYMEDRTPILSMANSTAASGSNYASADAVNTSRTVVVDSDVFAAGETIRIHDADAPEKFFVAYIVSKSTVTLTVKTLTIPTFNYGAGDYVIHTSNAYGEASDHATAEYFTPYPVYASTQLFKQDFALSFEMARAKDIMWGNDLSFQDKRALELLLFKIEAAMLWGSGRVGSTVANPWSSPATTSLKDSGSLPVPTTISLDQAIVANSVVYSDTTRVFSNSKSSTTFNDIIDNSDVLFEFGSQERWGFGGQSAISWITKMALKESLMTVQPGGNKMFGFQVVDLIFPNGGVIHLKAHKGMRGVGLANTLYCPDMSNIDILSFWEPELRDLATTTTSVAKEYTAHMGLCVRNAVTHGVFRLST